MTGPEHYREAEVLLGKAADAIGSASPHDSATEAVAYADHLAAAAQVHATLALVANDPERIAQAIERLVFDLERHDPYTEAIRDAAAVARGQAPSS